MVGYSQIRADHFSCAKLQDVTGLFYVLKRRFVAFFILYLIRKWIIAATILFFLFKLIARIITYFPKKMLVGIVHIRGT